MTDLSEAEEKAKLRWNAIADQYNQWSELGQDEKDHLVSMVIPDDHKK